ncbi:GAF and ANTAR domain-containing protein [Geodermatophilus sp. CPCC 206100]
MESLLQSLVDLTTSAMPGNSEASVTLLIEDVPSTVVGTGALAVDLDHAQYRLGDGPCLHTARTGVLTEIVDTRAEGRWPDYARHAAERGNLSSLAVPLLLVGEEQISGSLNVYARTPEAFDEASRTVATGIAPYAAVAAGTVEAYRSARRTADNLQVALGSRAVIEQAKGILMERLRLTPDQAFDALAQASMNRNVKVREIAEHLVLTGELRLQPDPVRGRPLPPPSSSGPADRRLPDGPRSAETVSRGSVSVRPRHS